MHRPYRISMATQYITNALDLRWTYEGVDIDLYGNGGQECAYFIPGWQKLCETVLYSCLALFEMFFAYSRLSLPDKIPDTELKGDRTGRKLMLTIMCIIFGIEIGFKCATRQVIWILNPCHVITILQIVLLVAPPRRYTTAVFRVSMHCLSGATVAILFPVVHTRTFPFEAETYFVQHALMLVTPYYLLRLGGAYTPEPLGDWSWALLSTGILFLYHFVFLQPIGMLIHINLNNMQCPAPSDPFFGRWYRSAAVLHQHVVVLGHGKLYTWVAQCFLPARPASSPPTTPIVEVPVCPRLAATPKAISTAQDLDEQSETLFRRRAEYKQVEGVCGAEHSRAQGGCAQQQDESLGNGHAKLL